MKRLPVCAFLVMAVIPAVLAAEKGWFGFEGAIKADGFFNPTVVAATIAKVEPKSPAAEKNISVGDEIVQIETTEVAGHKAKELKPLMQKDVGESLHLKLKRPNGEIYSVTLVAAKHP